MVEAVPPLLGAGELAGLLADSARRATVAALVLGADDLVSVRTMTGLDVRGAVTAIERLVDSGLVERAEDGGLVLLSAAFAMAARAAAPTPVGDDHGAATDEESRVLRAFVRDGRLIALPTSHSKRMVVLDLLVQEFEPGRRYSEAQVNALLRKWHDDVAALRRWLVDVGYLDRNHGTYWRCGGPVDV
jgi:hypothetical protein